MNKPLTIAPPLPLGTPNPLEGECDAEEAIQLLNALKWANDAAESDKGFAALQKLLDGLLPIIIGNVETAQLALSACRSRLEARAGRVS
jgi:hypothetical protein